jgi:predicted phage terminase large subunit-like protein
VTSLIKPWWQWCAEEFEPKPRRWPSPLAMGCDLDPATVRTPALDLIDSALVALAEGRETRLMAFLPPQEGKSSLCSRRLPAWLLEHDPSLLIGIVSYGADLAVEFGRQVKRDIEQHDRLGIQLRADSRAAGRWNTEQGGGLYCVGLAGSLTGRPLDWLIYDDVVKDRQQAESAAHRQRAWDHWEQVGKLRLSPRGRVVATFTRWHQDDLGGRLQKREADEWRVLAIPAVAGERVVNQGRVSWVPAGSDPLGRRPGEEMLSARGREPGYFLGLADRMARYSFRSIFQQRPTGAAGNLFPAGGWRYWSWVRWPELVDLDGSVRDLRDCFRFLTVDLAATKKTAADFTVAAAWALTMDRLLICLGRVRDRVEETGHWALVSPLALEWQAPDMGVESTMMGTLLVRQAVRANLKPFDLHADADKVTRAIPYGHMVSAGQVFLPESADWLEEWRSEHSDFPAGEHDDQVDVGAYAAKVAHGWHGIRSPAEPVTGAVDAAEAAMSAALGNGHRGRDPLDMI